MIHDHNKVLEHHDESSTLSLETIMEKVEDGLKWAFKDDVDAEEKAQKIVTKIKGGMHYKQLQKPTPLIDYITPDCDRQLGLFGTSRQRPYDLLTVSKLVAAQPQLGFQGRINAQVLLEPFIPVIKFPPRNVAKGAKRACGPVAVIFDARRCCSLWSHRSWQGKGCMPKHALDVLRTKGSPSLQGCPPSGRQPYFKFLEHRRADNYARKTQRKTGTIAARCTRAGSISNIRRPRRPRGARSRPRSRCV